MNTYDQVRLDAFRSLGTKVRLANSLEAAITTKINQRKLFLTWTLYYFCYKASKGMNSKQRKRAWKKFLQYFNIHEESQTCIFLDITHCQKVPAMHTLIPRIFSRRGVRKKRDTGGEASPTDLIDGMVRWRIWRQQKSPFTFLTVRKRRRI